MSDVTLVEDGGKAPAAAVPKDQATPEKKTPEAKTAVGTGKQSAAIIVDDGALDADEKAAAAAKWFADDWREKLVGAKPGPDATAERVAEYETALKQLARFKDPTGLWKKVQNQDKVIRETRQTPAKLGKDATAEQIAEYRKAYNIPEKPEDYLTNLQLGDGKVLGNDDKPIFNEFAKAMHEANAPPEYVGTAVDWYLGRMEQIATKQAEADDQNRVSSRDALRDEWGPADYARHINAAQTLFRDMPDEIRLGILHARMPDGRLLGDNPEIIKFWADLATQVNPAATVVPAGTADSAKSIDQEIATIRKVMREDRQTYNKDTAMQKRFSDLLGARERMKGKAA